MSQDRESSRGDDLYSAHPKISNVLKSSKSQNHHRKENWI